MNRPENDQRENIASTSPQPISAAQLEQGRLKHWHQQQEPLLSLEALREWLVRSGLVMFAPRAKQLGAPAPTLVEATTGKTEAEAGIAEVRNAVSLLARLVAEGTAVPLNLLGAAGGLGTDVPDFVVSAPVFSYIFTLRGNKAWKQAPSTSGPVKVSPLALAAYEMLSAKVMLSAYDLTTQLGKEVTEAAVLRALTELWSQLRVIPVHQTDGSATLWELASSRFTKQIKAGANAGQPSALSALISLYLGQAMLATEDEVESFLSPLAARSRVREVIHALLSARQLETIVIDGKTLLHVAGEAPAFAGAAVAEPSADGEEQGEAAPEAEGAPRIRKFAGKSAAGSASRSGPGLHGKPLGRPAFGSRPSGARPAFGSKPRSDAKSADRSSSRPASGDRERRPFKRDGQDSRPAPRRFDKPWEENRSSSGSPADGAAAPARPARPRSFDRAAGDRAPGSGGSRPPFGAKRPYTPRSEGSGEGPRKTFSKPGTFGRKREGFAGKPKFDGASDRPERREGERPAASRGSGAGYKRADSGFKRPSTFAPRTEGGSKPAFGARPRRSEGDASDAPRKVFRKFDAPRERKPFVKRAEGDAPRRGPAPDRGPAPERGPASERGPWPERGPRPERAPRAGFGAAGDRAPRPGASRPAGDRKPFSGERKPFSGERKSFSGPKKSFSADARSSGKPGGAPRPGGPFAKFADGKKPFRKPGPGKPAAKRSSRPEGGFSPVRRKRPEETGEGA